MKKGKWFFKAQGLLKEYRAQNNLHAECAKQIITNHSLQEEWSFWSDSDRMPKQYTLHAYKATGEVYLLPLTGEPVRIYLQQRTDLTI